MATTSILKKKITFSNTQYTGIHSLHECTVKPNVNSIIPEDVQKSVRYRYRRDAVTDDELKQSVYMLFQNLQTNCLENLDML